MAGDKSEKMKKAKSKDAVKKPGPIKNLVSYLGDVKRELKKVAWPTRADTLASTWVVIILSIIFSLFFFVCDSVLKFMLSLAFA